MVEDLHAYGRYRWCGRCLFVFGEFFAFNPVWWLSLVFVLAGLLGTSRMILRQHSLLQVVAGFIVGLICSILGLLYL